MRSVGFDSEMFQNGEWTTACNEKYCGQLGLMLMPIDDVSVFTNVII